MFVRDRPYGAGPVALIFSLEASVTRENHLMTCISIALPARYRTRLQIDPSGWDAASCRAMVLSERGMRIPNHPGQSLDSAAEANQISHLFSLRPLLKTLGASGMTIIRLEYDGRLRDNYTMKAENLYAR